MPLIVLRENETPMKHWGGRDTRYGIIERASVLMRVGGRSAGQGPTRRRAAAGSGSGAGAEIGEFYAAAFFYPWIRRHGAGEWRTSADVSRGR